MASGTQLSYTWTCPNGPCDVGEGNNPNRKTYGDRMVLNVLTSREEGMYTCLVRDRDYVVHWSNYNLTVQGGCEQCAGLETKAGIVCNYSLYFPPPIRWDCPQ